MLIACNVIHLCPCDCRIRRYDVYEAIWVCLKIVYPYTQWLMIIIPMKNGYFIGNIPYFQTDPYDYVTLYDVFDVFDVVMTCCLIDSRLVFGFGVLRCCSSKPEPGKDWRFAAQFGTISSTQQVRLVVLDWFQSLILRCSRRTFELLICPALFGIEIRAMMNW